MHRNTLDALAKNETSDADQSLRRSLSLKVRRSARSRDVVDQADDGPSGFGLDLCHTPVDQKLFRKVVLAVGVEDQIRSLVAYPPQVGFGAICSLHSRYYGLFIAHEALAVVFDFYRNGTCRDAMKQAESDEAQANPSGEHAGRMVEEVRHGTKGEGKVETLPRVLRKPGRSYFRIGGWGNEGSH